MNMDNEESRKSAGFFDRMKNAEHKGFEITMFSISSFLLVAVVAVGIFAGVYIYRSGQDDITDEEANAGCVTSSAIVKEEETAEPVQTEEPGAAIIRDNDGLGDDVDPDLKDAEYGFTTATVNLRTSPSLTSSVVAKVSSGVKVKIEELRKDSWIKVTYNGQTGYIHARYISATKLAPLATVAPRETETPELVTPVPVVTDPPATKKPKKTKKPQPTEEVETPEPTEEVIVTEEPVITPEPTQKPTQKPTPAPTVKPTKEPIADTPQPADPTEGSASDNVGE